VGRIVLEIHHQVTTAEVALAVSVVVGLVTTFNVRTGARHDRWQRERDAERRETRITVAFEHSGFYIDPPPDPIPPQPPKGYLLRILVVNSSETNTVWVRRVMVREAEGESGMDTSIGRDGPVRLLPGEPVIENVVPAEWPLDFSKGIVVEVQIVPDETQESEVEMLHTELMGFSVGELPIRIKSTPAPTSAVDVDPDGPRSRERI
jgi:hypothetical protein